jgi:hypothetical protein
MQRFVIGTLALVAVFAATFVMEGGDPLDFLLPTPLMIDILVPCCAVLAVWSLKDWGRAWKDAFPKAVSSAAVSSAAVSSARLWDFYEKACYISGIVAFILGLNVIFQYRGGVDKADIFRPLAVDCVAPIIAILFAMVARILRARVEENSRGA